jgi:hypothetical protein
LKKKEVEQWRKDISRLKTQVSKRKKTPGHTVIEGTHLKFNVRPWIYNSVLPLYLCALHKVHELL